MIRNSIEQCSVNVCSGVMDCRVILRFPARQTEPGPPVFALRKKPLELTFLSTGWPQETDLDVH